VCNNGGTCTASDGYNKFSCKCTQFFTGDSCEVFSVLSISLIVVGAVIIFVAITSKLLFDKYAKQKVQVLDEIRNNILSASNSAVITGSKNSDYIQHMQQALILNDVFVNYDDIKIEGVIGEGSFGVVHKGTFRGAQVAVKKMRSMFIQLSEKDIDEFRKEAYVMSRLFLSNSRHSLLK